MSTLIAVTPWVIAGIMFLWAAIFSVVSWRATKRANAAEPEVQRTRAALAQMEARARAAEGRLNEAEQRAYTAEQRIAQAEDAARRADETARSAEQRRQSAEQQAKGALDEARRADSALRERKNDADEKSRKAEQRARSLLDWARQQWESRREPDRVRAQAIQGSFQAQLEAYLDNRRAPVSFRVESEVDRLAAPLIAGFATSENVQTEGDMVRVEFPVDPSQGFRA